MSTFILKGALAPLVNLVVTIGFSLLAQAFFFIGTLGIRVLVPRARCWVLSGMSFLGFISISNIFPFTFTLANAFSYLPFYFFGLWKERIEYPIWLILTLTMITTVYTYHWVPCITSAIRKSMIQKPNWDKTPRFNQMCEEGSL